MLDDAPAAHPVRRGRVRRDPRRSAHALRLLGGARAHAGVRPRLPSRRDHRAAHRRHRARRGTARDRASATTTFTRRSETISPGICPPGASCESRSATGTATRSSPSRIPPPSTRRPARPHRWSPTSSCAGRRRAPSVSRTTTATRPPSSGPCSGCSARALPTWRAPGPTPDKRRSGRAIAGAGPRARVRDRGGRDGEVEQKDRKIGEYELRRTPLAPTPSTFLIFRSFCRFLSPARRS